MEALLGDLGRKISDRWAMELVVPGLIWLAVATVAWRLGHLHVWDIAAVTGWVEGTAHRIVGRPAAVATFAVTVLAGAAGAALAARAAAGVVTAVWLGAWGREPERVGSGEPVHRPEAGGPLRRLMWRVGRRLTERREQREKERIPDGEGFPERYLPARPTWIGDRFRLTGERLDAQYGLLLAVIWIPLWQVLPEPARESVRAARDRFDQSTRLAGWGVLYVIPGLMWWPGLVIAAVVLVTAWRRGRSAAAAFADTVEAVVDVHHRTLAEALGVVAPGGRLTRAHAAAVNDRLHKGHSRP